MFSIEKSCRSVECGDMSVTQELEALRTEPSPPLVQFSWYCELECLLFLVLDAETARSVVQRGVCTEY